MALPRPSALVVPAGARADVSASHSMDGGSVDWAFALVSIVHSAALCDVRAFS